MGTRAFIVRAIAVVGIVAAGVVLSEWLFFVTQPSFMSLHSPWEKLAVLGTAALLVAILLLSLCTPFVVVAALLKLWRLPSPVAATLALLPATVLLGLAILVMIDNFTQTLFGWGIRNSSGGWVYFYRVAMIALVVAAGRLACAMMAARVGRRLGLGLWLAAALLLVSGLPDLARAIPDLGRETPTIATDARDFPNIVILSGDGLSAQHLSVYGYERATTPFLDSVRDEFLISENHFSNAGDTGGAVIALLTGKLPTTTRVIYPPDVLRGHDSYQHLPGILKSVGYYNGDISMRHYADPYDLNLRGGYNQANFRSLADKGGLLGSTVRRIPSLNPASQLLDRISERITDRYDHVWKNKPMPDPLAGVNAPDERWIRDQRRLEEIRRFVDSAPQPFFLTVHMMGTHGSRFRPRTRLWSADTDYPTVWHVGAYNDAIRDFDDDARQVYLLLRDRGFLDNTILVISSDHGFRHDALDRVPLMMRLPGGAPAPAVTSNTQSIDIAPTLLDILGLEIPAWMEGRPLASLDGRETERPLFATGSRQEKSVEGNLWKVTHHSPPWFSLGRISMVYCDQGFYIRLNEMLVNQQPVEGSTRECSRTISPAEAEDMIFDHLRDRGYDWRPEARAGE